MESDAQNMVANMCLLLFCWNFLPCLKIYFRMRLSIHFSVQYPAPSIHHPVSRFLLLQGILQDGRGRAVGDLSKFWASYMVIVKYLICIFFVILATTQLQTILGAVFITGGVFNRERMYSRSFIPSPIRSIFSFS